VSVELEWTRYSPRTVIEGEILNIFDRPAITAGQFLCMHHAMHAYIPMVYSS
jgi:hypothetical protein